MPIATWLNNIGVAQFAPRNFAAPGHAAPDLGLPSGPRRRHRPLRSAHAPRLEFYNDRIGPYPYEKLADVEAAGMGGGMEHASEIFFGERTVNGRPASSLVAHEIAHQWFGDSVTESDWDDVWLSEGFATYFALLAAEHYEGRDAFVAGLKRSRTAVFNAEKRARRSRRAGQAVEGHAQPDRVSEGRLDAAHAARPARQREPSGPASANITAAIATPTPPPPISAK